MSLNKYLILVLVFLVTPLSATECDLTDINFPNSQCSFIDDNVNINALRFGKLDRVIAEGTVIRSGTHLYVVDGDAEILDTRDLNCVFDDDDSELDSGEEGNEIAFILDADSLRAPRVINKMWILDCQTLQAR